jgi:hypothetical protein
VLDLHIKAAEHHAVDLMLGSSIFTSQASTGTSGAAFFCIHLQEGVSSHYEPLVYALSSPRLSRWSRGSSADFWLAARYRQYTCLQQLAVPLEAAAAAVAQAVSL